MQQTNFKVLVIDDEAEVLDLLNYNFTKKGLDIYMAANGKIAFEMMKKSKPDVIIADIMMPEMNGIQFCELIKASPEFKDVPVLFLSATSDDLLILAAMTSGGDQFASKPIRMNILFDMIVKMHEDNIRKVA